MFLSPFRRPARPDTISVLYGTIVAQARLPTFYQDFAVADTVNGRFDLLVLHLALVLDRFFADPALQTLGQGLFDHFCADMDDNLREIGISDLKVPKEMRRMGEAFYGRAHAYREALAAQGDDQLAAAVARNVFANAPALPDAPRCLAAYMRVAAKELAGQETALLADGQLSFPEPDCDLKIAG